MQNGRIDILMYHSISDYPGPTNIAPSIFAQQIETIARLGVPVVSMDALLQARLGGAPLPPRCVVITFDDGFQDFADVAWPILQQHGFTAINYLPTRYVGEYDVWEGGTMPRPIMNWSTIKSLADAGALFGSHTVSHPNLTHLSERELDVELTGSRAVIEEKLERDVPHFAPPYGATNARVQARIAASYSTSVGTYLDYTGSDGDVLNLPRIEMFYFSDLGRWERYLQGRDANYLRVRRALRQVGKLRKLVG
jgi:peptidoglycan/xylan/chitin deacetylase (PgdA/CDA1 family)